MNTLNYKIFSYITIIIILCSTIQTKILVAQQETVILELIDDRSVCYYEPNTNYSSSGLPIIGSDQDGAISRTSSMWGPDPIGDWAYTISSGEIHLLATHTPFTDYTIKMRHNGNGRLSF